MAHSKKTKHAVNLNSMKKPGIDIDPQSYYRSSPVFLFNKYDADAPWSISSNGKPTTDSVFKALHDFEGLEWGAIIQASGGRKHGTNNHFIKVEELSKVAKKRAVSISLNESEIFSLRFQGDARLWGVIEPEDNTGKFYVIWFDPEHKVYPVKKR